MNTRQFHHLNRPQPGLPARKPEKYTHLKAWALGFTMGAFCAAMGIFMAIDFFTGKY